MSGKTRIIAAISCALMLLACGCKAVEQEGAASTPSVISPDVNITQNAAEEPDVLTVTGSGEVNLVPDMAEVYIQVRNTDADPAKAQQDNSVIMEAVLASLKADGVADMDIVTQQLSINEMYNYDKSPAALTGYEMTNSLKVTLRDVGRIGEILGNAIAAGATGTYGLSFTVSQSASAYQDALKAAVTNAKGKADAMAEALGLELIAVPLSITEQSGSYQPYAYANDTAVREAAVMDSAADVQISAGELSVSATVIVEYEMIGAQN